MLLANGQDAEVKKETEPVILAWVNGREEGREGYAGREGRREGRRSRDGIRGGKDEHRGDKGR